MQKKSNILQKIFGAANDDNQIHKVITILGVKFKFKSEKLILRGKLANIENKYALLNKQCAAMLSNCSNLQNQIKVMKNDISFQRAEILKNKKEIDFLKRKNVSMKENAKKRN